MLGVVLPRSAFLTDGSAGFRKWLFEEMTFDRVDFLVNRRLWIFDTHPQYTVALLAASSEPPAANHHFRIGGIATSAAEWQVQAEQDGIELSETALGPRRIVPLLRSDEEAEMLTRLRSYADPRPVCAACYLELVGRSVIAPWRDPDPDADPYPH